MKNFTLTKNMLLILFMLLYSVTLVYADNDGLITKQITIKLDEAGTLSNKIGSSRKYKITNLKIVGEINGKDWRMIRDLAGGDYDLAGGDDDMEYTSSGKLSKLDLSEAIMVEDSENAYASDWGFKLYVEDKETIPTKIFFHCSSLHEIKIPSYIKSIGSQAFDGSGLTSFIIPSSVTSIGDYAFRDCSSLTNVSIPSSVTFIDECAFKGCSSLTNVSIPSSISEISEDLFYGCSSLTSVTIPSSVTKIGCYAFYECSSLTSVTIPSSVTKIGCYAFYECSSLMSVNIPSSVTSIDYKTFKDCSSLTSLILHSSVTSIGDEAFQGCYKLKNVQYLIDDDIETYLLNGHPYIKVECGIEYYLNDKKLTSLIIPSTITKLGDNVFHKSSGLTSVYVSWPVPISAGTAFKGADVSKCTLYVPKGTEQDYLLADVWGDFGNIVEYNATGINNVANTTDAKEVSRYSVDGQQLATPTKGLNIVKYSDGTTRKVFVP